MASINRCIYVGLGEAGIKSILKTKKLFLESFSEVPPMVRFVAIDTDESSFQNNSDDCARLQPSECCQLTMNKSFYQANKEKFPWMCLQNEDLIPETMSSGTGGVRSNGRLAFAFNVMNIRAILTMAHSAVSSFHAQDNPRFEVANGSVEVHVVFSLGGGTGGGIFLDLAYLIRELFGRSVNSLGYALLPQETDPSCARANAYAAIQDLDYLMKNSFRDTPVTFNWLSVLYTEDDFKQAPTPFDVVYLLGSDTRHGVKEMTDAAGNALFVSCADTRFDLQLDTISHIMTSGVLDVNDKKAWVTRIGVSSIVFRGEYVASFWAKKRIVSLLDQALSSNDEAFLSLRNQMTSIKEDITRQLTTMSAPKVSSEREIDLTGDIIKDLKLNGVFSDIDDFVAFSGVRELMNTNSIEALKNLFTIYVENLPEFFYWKNRTLSDVLSCLSDGEIRRVLKEALEMSEPMLLINGKGWMTQSGTIIDEAYAMSLCVFTEDANQNRLVSGRFLDDFLGPMRKYSFVEAGFKDRVVFYRRDFVLPAYAIQSLESWKSDYDDYPYFCHFDKIIHERMLKENYSLQPAAFDSRALCLWVKGCILGLVKFDEEKGTYAFYDKSTDYGWTDTRTGDRKEAFDMFRYQGSEALGRFREAIAKVMVEMGPRKAEELAEVAAYGNNYRLHFSQFKEAGYTAAPFETLKANMEKGVVEKCKAPNIAPDQKASFDLFEEEIRYVVNHLMDDF